MTWRTLTTSQKTHLIQSIWRDGITATEIANAIGVTKGVISGHYWRCRDDLAETPLQRHGARLRVVRSIAPPEPTIAPYEPLYVSLADNNGCTWPLNDGGPYLFCGHAKFGKYSYCEHHHERSRGRGTDSERSAHKIGEIHVS